MSTLEDTISERRNTLKTDRLDMSFGELMNMFEDGDIIITPEFQRAFRWSLFQQTRFIESVLLGIPIPPIFVAEDSEGKWELVDGLQRLSTIFAFFELLVKHPEKNKTKLTEGELVKELDGLSLNDFPVKLRTTIKRSVCRVEIVRWDSNDDFRYELFNRLNTGACPLSEQEIRNCIFRSYPVDLNSLLRKIAATPELNDLIQPSRKKKESMFLEELVLRFFAFKYLDGEIKTTVPNYLSEFMKEVSKGNKPFNMDEEEKAFFELICFLNEDYGKALFRPKGNFALHIFDSLAYAIPKVFKELSTNKKQIAAAIEEMKDDAVYNDIGTSTFSNTRIKRRMEIALEIFKRHA